MVEEIVNSEIGYAPEKMNIRYFLADIAKNEIVQGKKYETRIEINDGGYNSYIALNVDIDDWKNTDKIRSLRFYRHTNSVDKLRDMWAFELGNICNPYCANPEIPLQFSSYGKTPAEAEVEAAEYCDKLKRLIRKQTADYKVQAFETAQEERRGLLARLAELGEEKCIPRS